MELAPAAARRAAGTAGRLPAGEVVAVVAPLALASVPATSRAAPWGHQAVQHPLRRRGEPLLADFGVARTVGAVDGDLEGSALPGPAAARDGSGRSDQRRLHARRRPLRRPDGPAPHDAPPTGKPSTRRRGEPIGRCSRSRMSRLLAAAIDAALAREPRGAAAGRRYFAATSPRPSHPTRSCSRLRRPPMSSPRRVPPRPSSSRGASVLSRSARPSRPRRRHAGPGSSACWPWPRSSRRGRRRRQGQVNTGARGAVGRRRARRGRRTARDRPHPGPATGHGLRRGPGRRRRSGPDRLGRVGHAVRLAGDPCQRRYDFKARRGEAGELLVGDWTATHREPGFYDPRTGGCSTSRPCPVRRAVGDRARPERHRARSAPVVAGEDGGCDRVQVRGARETLVSRLRRSSASPPRPPGFLHQPAGGGVLVAEPAGDLLVGLIAMRSAISPP